MRKKTPENQQKKNQKDTRFNNEIVSYLTRCLMKQGKKMLADTITYKAFDFIEDQLKKDPLEVFLEAIKQLTPMIVLTSRNVNGTTYQIPIEARPKLKLRLAISWLITYSRKRKEKTMSLRLANEIIAASKGEGSAIKRKIETHQ